MPTKPTSAASERLCARPGCGHRFTDHTEYDDVPCEGSHIAAPGSFVECECSGFVESETAPAAEWNESCV